MNIITTYRGIDYGARKGTLGIAIHMTEGNGGIGDVIYLTRRSGETEAQWRTRVRGVSANFVITKDGVVYQMVGWGRASGSMNPADESDEVGFYRQSIVEAVLGNLERDPNAYSISVEIAGKRADGPTKAQVDALVALVAEARRRYPTLRGAYGHADQTATKGCPGKAPLMMEAWGRIGHGLFLPDTSAEESVRNFILTPEPLAAGTFTVKTDAPHAYLRLKDGDLRDATNLGTRHGVLGKLTEPITDGTYPPDVDRQSVVIFGGVNACAILQSDVVFTPYPVDCTAPIAAAIAADRKKARIVYS